MEYLRNFINFLVAEYTELTNYDTSIAPETVKITNLDPWFNFSQGTFGGRTSFTHNTATFSIKSISFVLMDEEGNKSESFEVNLKNVELFGNELIVQNGPFWNNGKVRTIIEIDDPHYGNRIITSSYEDIMKLA